MDDHQGVIPRNPSLPTKGSLRLSVISWLSAVTSSNPGANRPGDINWKFSTYLFAESVLGISWLKVVAVKPQHAAMIGIAVR
jgi:hypothetical protein